MASARGRSSISIGGNVSGSAIVAGDQNQVNVGVEAGAPVDQASVVQALQELRELLAQVPGADAKRIANAADEALGEAQAAEPRKEVVAESLERALKLASGVTGVATQLAQLRPALTSLTTWLGSNFGNLLRSLGL